MCPQDKTTEESTGLGCLWEGAVYNIVLLAHEFIMKESLRVRLRVSMKTNLKQINQPNDILSCVKL